MSGTFDSSARRGSGNLTGGRTGHAATSTAPSSPYVRRSRSHRASVFSSASLNAHMEDARAHEIASSPKKSNNPRIPAPIEKVVPPPEMRMELLAPMSPISDGRQHRHSASDAARPVLSTVFVPVRGDHGAYVMLPDVEWVVRACRDSIHARLGPSSSSVRGGLQVLGDPAAVAEVLQHVSEAATVCGWVRYDAQDSAAPPIASTDAVEATGATRVLDLRWVPHAHHCVSDAADAPTTARAVAPLPHCTMQCALMRATLPHGGGRLSQADDDAADMSVCWSGSGGAVVGVAVTRDDGTTGGQTVGDGFAAVRAWLEALLLPRDSEATVPAGAPPTPSRLLCAALSACLTAEWASASMGTTWLVALPLCRLPSEHTEGDRLTALHQTGTAVIDVDAALPNGVEGYAMVSDGADNIYLMGGMVGQEFLSCSQRRHPPAIGVADAAFNFHRSVVRLRRTRHGGGLCFETTPRALHSKSLTVPGVAYHSAVMRNPPESLRDPPNRVLVFGGFLDCVRKATSTLLPRSATPSGSAASHSLPNDASERTATARYGWVDCIVDGVPYNTTADSPVFIPTLFNKDMVQQRARANGGASSSAPSWELAHMGDHCPRLTCTNALWMYDCCALTWQHVVTTGSVPSPRAHHTSVMCGQWMIAAGGVTGDCVPCSDIFALHVDQHLWVQILTSPVPLGLHPLLLATPVALLMAPRPSDRVEAVEEWTAAFSRCDLPKLLRTAQGKKRVALAALRYQADLRDAASSPSDADGSSRFVMRTQSELDAIMQRLTAADAASAAALAQLRDKHQEAADALSGASSHLRMVRRPASELDVVATRLLDKGRGERRFEAAMSFIEKRYNNHASQRKVCSKAQLEQTAIRLSDMTVAQWAKQHTARLKALEQRRLEMRLPPSAIRMRKRDASYQPPAIASEDIVERLAPKDYWERKEAFVEVSISKLETEHQRGRSGRRSPSPVAPSSHDELYRALYENDAQKASQCKLFEQYVVEPEQLRR